EHLVRYGTWWLNAYHFMLMVVLLPFCRLSEGTGKSGGGDRYYCRYEDFGAVGELLRYPKDAHNLLVTPVERRTSATHSGEALVGRKVVVSSAHDDGRQLLGTTRAFASSGSWPLFQLERFGGALAYPLKRCAVCEVPVFDRGGQRCDQAL